MERKINPEDVKVIDTPAEDFPVSGAGKLTLTYRIKNADEYKKRLDDLGRCIQATREAMEAVESFKVECFSKVGILEEDEE